MKRRARGLARWAGLLALVALLGLNVVAYLHARAMTHWAAGGVRTRNPEALGWSERAVVLLKGVELPRPADSLTPDALGLAFATHRFPNGRGDELEAWHVPADASDLLFLLFHGYGASKASMLPTAQALHGLGLGSLLVDFHGSGGSSGCDTTLGVLEALDVAAAVRFARQRWPDRSIVLYGQSMGGAAALRSIARHGVSPDGLVVEATFDRLLSTVESRFRAMGLPSTPLAHLLVFWGGIAAGIDGFDHNPVDDAAEVDCPTLVFHGLRDARVTSAEAASVHDRLRGWKRFSEFESGGHGPVVLSDRVRWAVAIQALIVEIRRSIDT